MCTHQNFCIFFLRDTFSILKHAAQVSFDKAAASIKAWRVAHKRWTDRRARQRRNAKNDSGDLGVYSGDCSPMLRMMTDVMQRRGYRATSCTCGVPQMTSVPCRHIVAVTKSGKADGLNMVTAMPFFWSTNWWRKQFPMEETIRCNIDLQYLKEQHEPDNNILYCPDIVGLRKKGCPKKDNRKKSPLEEALAKSRGKKNVRKRHVATEAELMGVLGAIMEDSLVGGASQGALQNGLMGEV